MRTAAWFGVWLVIILVEVVPARADVTCRITSGTRCIVEITGTIVPGDHDAILRQFEPHASIPGLTPFRPSEAQISLNSEGGSVSEALKIGRLLRSREFTAIVPIKRQCLSSCVFVLMGAVERQVYGPVGIHRPYFGHFLPDAARDKVVQEFDAMRGRLQAYAREMRIPETLIDLMYSIDPADMAALSEEELSYYGLNRIDPAFEELKIMKESRQFMVTPTEYRRRLRLVEKLCHPLIPDHVEDFVACYTAMQMGLSIEEFESRRFEFDIQVNRGWPDERKRACFVAIMIQGGTSC